MGNYSFEIDRIGLTKGRDDTKVENGIFRRIARPRNCLLYDFCVTIGTSNNERAIQGNSAL